MSAPAAITGDYCDLRFVKGRKVAVIHIEIPIEAAGDFVKACGTPSPATGVPVAIARLKPDAKQAEPVKAEKPQRKWGELSRAEQAGIACTEMRFWRFLSDRAQNKITISNADEAATAVRSICNVCSRAILDNSQTAALAWDSLYSDFQFWLRAPEVVG